MLVVGRQGAWRWASGVGQIPLPGLPWAARCLAGIKWAGRQSPGGLASGHDPLRFVAATVLDHGGLASYEAKVLMAGESCRRWM